MNQKSLFARCFTSYLWITTALVVLIGLYGCHLMRRFYLDQTQQDLETRARLSAKQLATPLAEGDFAAVDALCKDLGRLMNTRITVVLVSGDVVGDTSEDPKKMENHSDRSEIRQARREGFGSATHYSRTLREERMYVAVAAKDETGVRALVRTSIPVPTINQTLATLYYDFLTAGLIIAVVAAGVSLWISLRISRSLEPMMAKTHQTSHRELAHRFADLDDEEIDELEAALDRSAEPLAQKIRDARRESSGA
jgi:two-component system phosphate regulon sensor histidine kinase PhoR